MSFAKFELGFPNEGWNERLDCLIVPIPDTDKVVYVNKEKNGKFCIHTREKWKVVDNIMMAAALVHDIINNYVTTGGNLGQKTNPQA